MDKTVPKGAAALLDFIGGIEAPRGYETIYGNNQSKLPKPLTKMTLGEVVDAGPSWTKRFKSSACGRYQFMRATLQGLAKELQLSGTQEFNADFQDRMGFHLLKRRGYESYMDGKISRTEFGKRLAQEWASFPVLANTKGAKRNVTRGQSFYAGDGLNKSLVSPERVEAVLDRIKSEANLRPVLVDPVVDDNTIERVQQLLREKGYPEVGNADNKFGNRTRNAILAFQADNNLPLTGRVSDSLLSSLIKAPKRVEASERSEATKQDLSSRSIVKAGDALKVVGGVVAAGSAVGGGVDSLDSVNERLTAAQNLYNTVTTFTPWLLGIVAGGIVVYFGYQIISKYLQQYREGRVL